MTFERPNFHTRRTEHLRKKSSGAAPDLRRRMLYTYAALCVLCLVLAGLCLWARVNDFAQIFGLLAASQAMLFFVALKRRRK